MKLYKIRDWDKLYENNRSRTVKDLSWVAIPNKHDGENFTLIMSHKRGAEIFSAFVLMVQVASKCSPRGTLIRSNGIPHTGTSLSVKCRAPVSWFEVALEYLESETDWLEVEEVSVERQEGASQVPAPCQAGAQEGKGRNGKKEGDGIEGNGAVSRLSQLQEVFDEWNKLGVVPQCLVISDKRRHSLSKRLKDSFFITNWRESLKKIKSSPFCQGKNDRGWKASFDWFLQPDSCAKIMEGKYDQPKLADQPKSPKNNGGYLPYENHI